MRAKTLDMSSSAIQQLSAVVAEVCGLLDDSDVRPDTRLREDLGLEWIDVQVILERLTRAWQLGGDPEQLAGRISELCRAPGDLTVAALADHLVPRAVLS